MQVFIGIPWWAWPILAVLLVPFLPFWAIYQLIRLYLETKHQQEYRNG